MKRESRGEEGLGPELGKLWEAVPVPKAPPWFAARTLARLRREEERKRSWRGWARWILVGAGATVLVVGGMRWEREPILGDAEVFAALDAMVAEEQENRWWAGL